VVAANTPAAPKTANSPGGTPGQIEDHKSPRTAPNNAPSAIDARYLYQSPRAITAMDAYQMFHGTGLTHLLVVQVRDDEVTVARGDRRRNALGHQNL
jgi:hypothetical protein